MGRVRLRNLIVSLAGLLWMQPAAAQPVPLNLNQAVQGALARYPSVKSSLEQVRAASAGINLARTSYLPRGDFMGQVNRATHNNVFGQLLPQSVIPSMTGPVLGTNSQNNVWGSAVGALVSWEPFDFGLRHANVEVSKTARERAAQELVVTKLQVATASADAFLTIAAAQQAVIAARAGADRAQVFDQVLETLVKNELRPGADASRSRAELALAQNQQIQAEQARDVARAALAALLGVAPETIAIEPGPLLRLPESLEIPVVPALRHPLALARDAAVNEVTARVKALDRSYFPRFSLQGASFARGTGVGPDGRTGDAASGLAPNTQNWALGASVTFPAFDWFSIRARRDVEVHNERSAAAFYEQTILDVSGQVAKARAVLDGARRIAQNTPILLQASRDAQVQATARYKAGLATIAEVAEAQRLLTQSEIDNSLAQLGVWRAMLGVAAAQGDLTPFLAAVGK
jgi:outer membrane protein